MRTGRFELERDGGTDPSACGTGLAFLGASLR